MLRQPLEITGQFVQLLDGSLCRHLVRRPSLARSAVGLMRRAGIHTNIGEVLGQSWCAGRQNWVSM